LADLGWLDHGLWLKVGSFCRESEAVTVDNGARFWPGATMKGKTNNQGIEEE